ncbi:MAG: acyl-CoA dehydrogenase [Peptococcaceae bacterium]|nr:acyl-CoA dehydrogenase [Peptococcaceae bacterium]
MGIDISLTPEQQKIQQAAREFTAKYVIPNAGKYDRAGEFPEFLGPEAVKAGIYPPAVPKEYGGPGLDLLSQAIIAEEIGYGCGSFANILCGNMMSAKLVLLAGTEEQKKLYTKPLVEGGYAGFALTEPGSGSDAGSISTQARPDGDEYVLNGSKCFASFCGYATNIVVFASTSPGKGVKGLSAFIVEMEREGMTVASVEHKLGIRSSNSVELVLKNVRVPKDHLIGSEGEGFKYAMKALDTGRAAVGYVAVGVAQRALDEAVKYCKEYIDVNGQPLSAHQSIAFRLADMAIQVEAARQLARRVVRLQESGAPYTTESCMAKTFATDTAMRVCAESVTLLGPYGYSQDGVVEKLMRDIKIFQIFEGSNQIQRLVISRNLLAR